MSDATETPSGLAEAREAIALACRIHGRKRGLHIAAGLLRHSERWASALHYGEPVGAIDYHTAHAALMSVRRQRAAQLRAELTAMENDDLAIDLVARAGAECRICG